MLKRLNNLTFSLSIVEMRSLGLSFIVLSVVALIVFTQNYVKHAHTVEYFSISLSLAYNLIVYSTFALFAPLIIKAGRQFPLSGKRLPRNIAIHLVVSAAMGLTHMLFCNLVLFTGGLSSAPIFPRFITKYLTNVIHFHLLAYWTILGLVSYFGLKRQRKSKNQLDRFVIRTGGNLLHLELHEVVWIEALDHYQKLHTANGFYLYKDSMSNLEQTLSQTQFLRVHRSAIVNVDHIESFQKPQSSLKLTDGNELAVGKSFRAKVLAFFK